tara:strand:+ start:244 stop:864 length:621 start_codon:yes stop_codon:yes gene_type:complete
MARVIKLKESDITNIVRRILREDRHYGGNKGDLSKTHKGRDYEGQGKKEITFDSMMEALGNPRTMDDVLRGYEKMYNASEKVEGVPTPQEIGMRVSEIEETTPDPAPAMIIWLIIGTLVALGIRWINGTNPWTWNSDVTLKENIDLVGRSTSGINIYEFDYINKKYGNGRYRGVMAQEVPSASFVGPEGTLMVDYSKIDVNFEELN